MGRPVGGTIVSGGSGGASSGGDVVGPASATTSAVVLYNGTTGKLVKNSVVTITVGGDVDNVNNLGVGGTLSANTVEVSSGAFIDGGLTLDTALGVASGGIGAATLTAHGVLVGAGTSAVVATTPGTAGQVLTSNGASADPTFQAAVTGIGGSTGAVDNAVLRADGTGGATAQSSGVRISDTGVVQLGGTSSSFPGLRNNSGTTSLLDIVLADGSTHTGAYATRFIGSNSAIEVNAGNIAFLLANNGAVNWNSGGGASTSGNDVGLRRDAAGVLRVDDGTGSGVAKLLTRRLVEASTVGSGAPNLLAANESRSLLTNEGATAENYHTLPTAVAGYEFVFYCQDTDGIRVVANTGDTIRLSASVSASAGFVRSVTVGSCITLVSINATEWIATSIVGTWLVDT